MNQLYTFRFVSMHPAVASELDVNGLKNIEDVRKAYEQLCRYLVHDEHKIQNYI